MNNNYLNSLRANPLSSSVLLIDENLCLAPSLDILNTSLSSLGLLVDSIRTQVSAVQTLFNVFQSNSAVWLPNMDYIADWQDAWIKTAASVSATSAIEWVKTISLICPVPQIWEDWFISAYPSVGGLSGIVSTNISTRQQLVVDGWLNTAFPASNFVVGQTILVHVPILQTISYDFVLDQKYTIKCDEHSAVGSIDGDYCNRIRRIEDPIGTNYFGPKCNEPWQGDCIGFWPDGGLVGLPYLWSCSKNSVNGGAFTDSVAGLGCQPYLPISQQNRVSYNDYTPLAAAQIKHIQYIASGSSYPGANPSATPFFPAAGANFSDFYKEKFVAKIAYFKVRTTYDTSHNLYWLIIP